MDYDKQPINVDEQVALLQNRGLVIEDIATAKLQLRNISYFRIASYLRYMEEDRQFREGKHRVKKQRKKQHGQIEFVRTNCPAVYKLLIFNHLQAPGQKSRTNSICPCF